MKEEVCLEVELLNQACLDLVAQIERLEKENARLKKRAMEGNEKSGRPRLSDSNETGSCL
jgi:hypothetical protein